ncbi:MAG TPA: hypothetical protein VGD68_02300 [Streptosporangiaceae bacterium]
MPDVPDGDPGAQERREFRAWVRAHHPDAGGDPDSFVTGLAAWHQHRGQPVGPGPARPGVTVFRTRHGMWVLIRWWRRHRGTRRVR